MDVMSDRIKKKLSSAEYGKKNTLFKKKKKEEAEVETRDVIKDKISQYVESNDSELMFQI